MVFYRILPKLAGVLFSVALAVMLAGCSSSSEPQKKTPVQMTVVFPQTAKAQKAGYAKTDTPIASVTIEVSGPDMTPMSSTVAASSGKTVILDLDILNGQDRLILAKILDPYGDILFQGSITARLDGTPLALSIALQPVAPVSGKTDRSFGQDGQAIFSQEISGGAMVMQFDGRILLAGTTDVGDDFVVIRSDASGALDTGFGTDGKAVLDLGGADVLSAMVVQSDGKILLAGTTDAEKTDDFVVIRLDANGALDTGFGKAGKTVLDLGGSEALNAMAIQSDGKILLAGTTDVGETDDFVVVRLDTKGALDAGFGTGGKAVLEDLSGSEALNAMAIQSDGKILLAGTTDAGKTEDFVVVRLDTNGALNTGFGTGGKAVLDLGGTDVLGAMAIQSNGEILLAGTTDVGKTEDFVVAGYTTSGQLNTAFGQAGQKIYDLGEGDQVHSLGIQSSGRIVVSGNTEVNGVNALALVRYYP